MCRNSYSAGPFGTDTVTPESLPRVQQRRNFSARRWKQNPNNGQVPLNNLKCYITDYQLHLNLILVLPDSKCANNVAMPLDYRVNKMYH
jgi:hypothetical protein